MQTQMFQMMVNKQMRQLRITPYILSAPHPSAALATRLLGQMHYQKGAGFTTVRLPGHGCGHQNTEVWLELNGLHWLP